MLLIINVFLSARQQILLLVLPRLLEQKKSLKTANQKLLELRMNMSGGKLYKNDWIFGEIWTLWPLELFWIFFAKRKLPVTYCSEG